jgi:hypothetical protein
LRRLLVVLVLVSAAACGATSDQTLDVVFDPCDVVDLVAIDATADQVDAIDGAATMWRAVIDASSIGRGEGDGAALPIRFEHAAAAFRGVYLDEEGVVVVNRSLDGSPAQAIAIAHELGHALGLWHVARDERRSVMNPGNLEVAPTEEDAAEIAALWGECPPPSGPTDAAAR